MATPYPPFPLPPSKPPLEPNKGVKYDKDKPQYGLLPADALLEMAKNLTFGAAKYSPGNWRKLENLKDRYFDAAQRHIWAWKMNEQNDPENDLHHLAAAAVNLMFILQIELEEKKC